MKNKLISLLMLAILPLAALAADVKVILSGLATGDKVMLSIASGSYLATIQATENGTFTFVNVPEGKHSVKAEATGYNVMKALTVEVKNNSVVPSQPLKIAVTKMSENPDSWNFEWKEDGSPSGYTTTAHKNEPAEIEFLGKMIVPADVPSFSILKEKYNIVLANDEKPWSQEYAYRMVETMKTLPLFYNKYPQLKPAKFSLTAEHLADDISVVNVEGGCEVRISEDAFYYANPFLVDLDGKRGRLFSKRLHHALTNYMTDFGRNISNVNDILSERFGCSIINIDYTELTQATTQEDAACFQQFKPAELVSIINMFEEFPEGFRKVPHLKYLIRRQNGHDHKLYPEAAAVAWPTLENGYIEFMEKAFGGNSQELATQRLILHEKTHFLWQHVFSEEIKAEWIKLGGWYKDPNQPSGWSTTKTTEFVSAYAHGINPNEDMAESVADYVKNPAILMSRSIGKYEFIRDRIMHGVRYITTVPDHLSFEVLNLWPDYDFPGKIKRASITVDGKPEADKLLTMEIELNDMPNIEDGASYAYTRITSPKFLDNGETKTQFYDIQMNPVEGSNHILRGTALISKYSKAGHWTAGDITTKDLQGNQRHEGHNDCVTDFFINNPMEDLHAAQYESGSLNYEITDTILEGRQCQNLKITCKVKDDVGIQSVQARVASDAAGFSQSVDYHGRYNPKTQMAEFNFPIKDFLPTANYYVSALFIKDFAATDTDVWFSESPQHEPVKKIFIQTSNPDTVHAEIDLNRIYVYAEPTHPEAPDGETKVTVNFYARDNISGLGTCEYYFIDPQGVRHGNYYYEHRNSRTEFFDGNPTVWEHHQIVHILPRGSVPGRWGLASLNVRDKAFNEYVYNFLETLIFEPDTDLSKYELFADITDSQWLSISLASDSGSHFGFKYRIIHEQSGKEISGIATGNSSVENRSKRGFTNAQTARIDVSSLPDGELVVIANVLDENGKIETAKSAKVTKKPTECVVSISSDRYTTFVPPVDVATTEKVTAYTVKVGTKRLFLTALPTGTTIPAGNAVVLKAATAGEYRLPAVTESQALQNNDLLVTTESLTADGTQYVFGKHNLSGKMGFEQVSEATTIPAGKVYLKISSQQANEIKFFFLDDEIPSQPTRPMNITTGYYLLKQVNDKPNCAGGQRGVGFIKYEQEKIGTKVTSVDTEATPNASNYIWYVEVKDNQNITISTTAKVASWNLPSKATGEQPLVAYDLRTELVRVTDKPEQLGNATTEAPKENACFLTNTQKDSYVHFSGDYLGSWTNSGVDSTFMIQFYSLDEGTMLSIAKQGLTKAINEAESKKDLIGSELGQYSQPQGTSDIQTLITHAQEALEKGDVAAMSEATAELQKVISGLIYNQPVVGHFYAFKGKVSHHYIDGTTMQAKVKTTAKEGENFKAGQVFYLNTENKLLNYAQGYHLSDTHTLQATGVANKWTFSASQGGHDGHYVIMSDCTDGKYLSDNGSEDNTFCDRSDNYKKDSCDWLIEEVTSLPVTVSNAGWATLYAPVPLTIPSEVKVYTGKVSGKKLILSPVQTTIPAHTPVLIEATANTYQFTIDYEAVEIAAIDQSLDGTIETKVTPTDKKVFTLQKLEDALGFFKYTGTNLQGFRVYGENLLGSTSSAMGLVFDYGEVTGIEGITTDGQKAEIYDLSGRRMAKAQKGIYIIDGKKVILK